MSKPDATYARLQQRADAAAAHQRSRPRDDFFRAMDKAHAEQGQRHGAAVTTPHVSVRDVVLPEERAARLAHRGLAEQVTRWLTIYPPPTATTDWRVAAAVRNLHDAVQSALTSSDPAPVEAAMDAIDATPERIDSPPARAASDYTYRILPLLNRGRSVPATVGHAEALVQQIQALLAELAEREAHGAPPSDPILYSVPDASVTPPRRAVSGLSGGAV